MELVEIPTERIDDIEPLWRELNAYHLEKSHFFKEYFFTFTFQERCKKLLARDQLKIFAAWEQHELVGYCLASVYNKAGEIDSIYIKPHVRGKSLGMKLMGAALSWLSGIGCTQITISVVEGNEEAIPFYEKFGFKVKSHMLQRNDS